MSKKIALGLIAMVATAVMVEGQRVIVQAGEPLPEPLTKRDRDELLSSKAAAEGAAPASVETGDVSAPEATAATAPTEPAPPTASEPQSRPKKK